MLIRKRSIKIMQFNFTIQSNIILASKTKKLNEQNDLKNVNRSINSKLSQLNRHKFNLIIC